MDFLRAFDRPQNLINFSTSAIEEAHAAWKNFANTDNFPIVGEIYNHSGDTIVKVVLDNPIPDIIERRFTEALNNLRNSFDQSLFAICSVISKPIKDAHFPWAQNPDPELKHKFVHKKTGNILIPPETWDVIKRHEPYRTGSTYSGGNDLIRDLAKIANSKHTVGIKVDCLSSSITFPSRSGPLFAGEYLIEYTPKWDVTNNEMILTRYKTSQMVSDGQYSFVLDININAPPPAGVVSAFFALYQFRDKAQAVLNDFKALALEIKAP